MSLRSWLSSAWSTVATLTLFEIALGCGSLGCCWVLYRTAFAAVVHILSGFFFMGVAAWTLVKGQVARRPVERAGWYIATGATFFLFLYWALTVVFRAPVIPQGVGCGGVKFIHEDGQVRDEL